MSDQLANSRKEPSQVMKFGGTSVGDAAAIRRVVEIVHASSRASRVVVVVSAMSGVTNQLLEAARQAEAGNRDRVRALWDDLRFRHRTTVNELVRCGPERRRLHLVIEGLFEEGERLCKDTVLFGDLTLRARDAISGLGERMSAPIIAAALNERGVASEAVEATELIRTDSHYGAAEPDMAVTRELCQERLCPLLQEGLVPVVTGFIGATGDGTLTTFGRGGSDYSAAILGAALDADEITVWTDVDGLMTADPRLIPSASTIAHISYREAAELARYGAKVLHPKTLSPVAECGIPVRIRNTFAPQRPGTHILPFTSGNGGEITALAMMSDPADASFAKVTAVGRNMRDAVIIGRILTALASHGVNLVSVPFRAEQSFSFSVAKRDVKRALEALHSEFRLGGLDLPASAENLAPPAETWLYAPAQGAASAD